MDSAADSFHKADFLRYMREQKHIMLLYDNLENYRQVASAFVVDGLLSNDRCIMVTDEYAPAMVHEDLSRAGLDVQDCIDRGQLVLVDAVSHYASGDDFDPDAALERWMAICTQSLELGFDNVRGVGEAPVSLAKPGVDKEVIYYENLVNQKLFPDYPFMSLGCYSRKDLSSEILKGAIQCHPMLVCGTRIIKNNIYYVPPEVFFSRKSGASEIEGWLANVEATNQRAQDLVKKEEEISSIFNGSNDAFFIFGFGHPPGNFIRVNEVACRMLDYTREELLEMSPLDISCAPEDLILSNAKKTWEKGDIHFNTVLRKKDGTEVPVGMSSRLFSLDGKDAIFSAARDISAQLEAEHNLRQALEVTNDGIWEFDLATNRFTCSKRWADMLGYESEDISVNGEFYKQIVHPADRARFEKEFADCIEGRTEDYALEMRLKAKDSSWKWIYSRGRIVARDLTGRPVKIIGAHTDISDQKRIEDSLRKSEQVFRMLYDDAPVSYQSLDVNGNFVSVNREFCRTLGYTREELIGRNFSELLHPDWVGHFLENFPRFKAMGEVLGVEFHMKRKDGEYILVSFTGRIGTRDDGSFRQTHCVFRDITRERKYENELIKARDAAEQASLAKSMFLANMSHELRTPLSGIMGMHQLLQSTDLTREQDKYISMAIGSAKRLSGLLGDILDLTRIETGKMGMVSKPFELGESLAAIEHLFGPICTQKGVELDIRADSAIPPTLLGDSVRLQQVLNNLVGNSVKFTEQGRISVEASLMPHGGEDQCRVLLTVSDTGIGIPEGKMDSLFDAFTQVDEGYKRAHQGAGLGLSIVRQLVHLMDGSLAVASEPGKGTTFHFSLPFGLRRDAVDTPVEPLPVSCADPCPHVILLVEDEAVNRLAIKGILGKMGYRVKGVANGALALEELVREQYGLVIMDIQMPVMDGVEATHIIRSGEAGEHNADIPIVALTAYSMTGDREKFMAAGMDGYLAKPVEMESLARLLDELLK